MRTLRIALLIAVMAFVAIVPSFADNHGDDLPTIADIVVASTEGEAPEFTVLLAALGAADPAFLELVADPEAGITVFAPTDAAFVALLEALGATAEEVLANTELLNSVLAYHVVPGIFDAEAVVGADGALIGTFLKNGALAVTVTEEGGVMVNESNVVAADVLASNGVVHVIDAVLVPAAGEEMEGEMMEMEEPTLSIAETVIAAAESADAPEFTVLLAAVLAADPSIADMLTNDGPFTVFAPTDAAFAALLEALGVTAEDVLADTELLNAVLAYHVVPGSFDAATVVAVAGEEGFSIATFNGILDIAVVDGGVVINEAVNVVATDIYATNGVIHVIDAVVIDARTVGWAVAPPTERDTPDRIPVGGVFCACVRGARQGNDST
ncbi:MAG: fasciclin domain-containing protein [Anaerolineae bacterium]|nr:fasciclin domain-containing protein [Anaerolineae bacterium]